jgi:hypothetical protein
MKRHTTQALAALVVLLAGPFAAAADRVEIPDEQPLAPIYARFETVSDVGFTDRELVCIPFYRDPVCVPEDFNLLDFFDRPRAWECDDVMPPYVEGFSIRSLPPPFPPEHFFVTGLPGMPVWFVDWEELLDVYDVNDGVVTIVDLENMASIQKGEAEFYMEEIQTDVNAVSSHRIVTSGELWDGTPFFATYNHGAADQVPKVEVRIEIGE